MPYSIILTAFNEGKTLTKIVEELESEFGQRTEIIVVDDGSTDGTHKIASRLAKKYGNIRAIKNKKNLGRGASLKKGAEKARGNIIGIIDADMQYSPADLARTLKAVKKRGADIVCGRRRTNKNGVLRRLLSTGYNIICRTFFSVPVHDANSGIKAIRRDLLRKMPLQGGAYRLICARTAKEYRIAEIRIEHRKRICGNSRIPTPKIFIETLQEFIKIRLEK